ncbi:MAG TPA: hypothetical protein VE775_04485, partial [Pyrinomonadaceae bacterium]|nr:hypothetical protein [Pyrinomonadaceae bacterium]
MITGQLQTGVIRRLAACGCAVLLLTAALVGATPRAQDGERGRAEAGGGSRRGNDTRGSVRSVTIPVTVNRHGGDPSREEMQQLDLIVHEDGEAQEILSARGVDRAPLALALLMQDDVVSPVGNELKGLVSFVRGLPDGSRVLVAYLRAGSPQIRQRFTNDLEKAAKSLRIPAGSPFAAPYNPYVGLIDALKRFDALPTGRRAVLLVSDGVDISHGIDSSSPSQSVDLERAIAEAQRRGIAV